MAAASIMPGIATFVNFKVTPEIMAQVDENILDDFIAVLPPNYAQDELEEARDMAKLALGILRKRSVKIDKDTNPFTWYPSNADLAILFEAIVMLLGIPASSEEYERSFSSASFTLDIHRYRIDIETFRKEHRLRRFITSGTDCEIWEGRKERLARLNALLEAYDVFIKKVIPEEH